MPKTKSTDSPAMTKKVKVEEPTSSNSDNGEYEKFVETLSLPINAHLTEESALQKLKAIDPINICIQVSLIASTPIRYMLMSCVFKTRSQYFPPPCTTGLPDWDNYNVGLYSKWCFYQPSNDGCTHKGCFTLRKCFEKASETGSFYRAVYLSLTKNTPKTSETSLLNFDNYNCTYTIFEVENDCRLFMCVPHEGIVYYGFEKDDGASDRVIKTFDVFFKKGKNRFEFLNRRTTGFSIPIQFEEFAPGVVKCELDKDGSIVFDSTLDIHSDVRLSLPIFRRKFNYSIRYNKPDAVLCSFDILCFKDCIYLNRNSTEVMIQSLIRLLGGIPLSSDYKRKMPVEYVGRVFYFLCPNSDVFNRICNLYKTIIMPLTLLEVKFDFNVNFEDVKLPESLCLTYERLPSDNNPVFTHSFVTPLRVTPNTLLTTQLVAQDNYILIKPTGNKIDVLPMMLDTLYEYGIRIHSIVSRDLTETEFQTLYPACMNRVFGQDWHQHMFAGPILVVKTSHGTWQTIRSACWQCRKRSGLPWVKNVVHSASNDKERLLMSQLFEYDFLNINNVCNFSAIGY